MYITRIHQKLNWPREYLPLVERTQGDDDEGKRELSWIV